MRVLITGGTGLIGNELTNNLCADGHDVIILSRSGKSDVYLPSRARLERWDGRTAEGWGHLVNEVDAIVNLAGESISGANPVSGRWTAARKKRIVESRVQGGQAIMQALSAATRRPQVLVQASAVGYYGPHGDDQVTEETPPGNDFLANVCKQWEASTAGADALGVRVVVMRTGIVLSMGGGALPFMALPFRYFVGGPLGSGRQYVPWIHEEDEIGAIRFMLDHESMRGAYNLCAPQPVTNAAFGKSIGRALRRPSYLPAPEFALRLALGEFATLIVDGQRQIPRRLQQTGFRFKYEEVDSALRDLLR